MRAVAGDTVSSTSSSVRVEGKLLVLLLVDSPNSRLRLSFQLVSATVAGTSTLQANLDTTTFLEAIIARTTMFALHV